MCRLAVDPRLRTRIDECETAREMAEKSGLHEIARPGTPGELNYAITRLIDDYLIHRGGIRYAHLNEVVGALECAKLELYRRVAGPYEDQKREETGDVYRSPQVDVQDRRLDLLASERGPCTVY